jgi:hypothetical protein
MATNGILDIQETTEDFRDPDMELGPDEMMDIIKTLQVVGVPQEQHGEFTEEFRIWKQNNNGTFDMFLEEKYQLPPGTITKIKTTQQVATGPEDTLTEEDMTIQPGSGEMLDIMQSVGAPQRARRGGRIGYQAGEIVLPEPRPEHDPRAGFFERMGAMPEQTLLQRAGPTRAPEGIMGQTQDPFGGLLGGEEGDIGMGGQPLGEYEHEGAEQPPSWWDRAKTGTYDGSQDHSIDMEMIIDFLKKMGMALTQENIAKAAKALGMAMKFGPMGASTSLGIAGLRSLGGPGEEDPIETEEIGFQEGGPVFDINLFNQLVAEGMSEEEAYATAGGQAQMDSVFGVDKKAKGGIINAVPRQGYFLGDIVSAITSAPKKILKSAKKILKSDFGKMAMLYIATSGFANIAAQQGMGGAQKWFGKGGWQWLKPSKAFGIGEEGFGNIGQALSRLTSKVPFVGKENLVNTEMSTFNKALKDKYLADMKIHGVKDAGPFSEYMFNKSKDLYEGLSQAKNVAQPWYKGALPWIGGAALAGGAYTAKYPGEEQFDTAKRDAEVNDWTKWLAAIQPAASPTLPYPDYVGAKGGRVGYANGGILDIEEVDLRDNGGFMPLGKKEKADDVPALLSKNEFVFTADAVKSAGEGDPDVGAERMQNVMKNLEAGGKISEESQGLEGAQDMFEVSERLSEVV